MSADFSRVRHDPLLDWAGVELKQGGVLLDADANQLVAVIDRRLRALAGDVLGRSTVSQTTPNAFQLSLVAGMLAVGRGRMYVDGLLAENHGAGAADWDPLLAEARFAEPLRYDAQPYLPAPPALPDRGRHLVYLDVWQRTVTHLEDPALVEIAVGVETSSRLQTVWQLRVLEPDAGSASCPTPDADVPGWAAIVAPSDGRLTTGTFDVAPIDDPCELPPTGGYRGTENHLYRVEIHDPGTAAAGASFKWSRENASVGSRVAALISATELELDTLGRDDVLSLKDGDWVEIVDDVREFSQAAGEMRRIAVDVANRRISFAPALPAAMLPAAFPDSVFPRQRNLRVRRWDQRGRIFRTGAGSSTVQVQDLDAPGSTGLIDVPAAGTTLLLEDGVTVRFASGARGFRAGDHWVFAARTADTSVEVLVEAPPRGIHHHFARLGFWDVAAGTLTDCRNPWPPDVQGSDCGCTECVTPASHASGALTIQAAVDRLRDSGGTVCLHTGTYALAEPVRISGARSITVRGQGPASLIVAAGTAFLVERSAAILIEKMAIVSLGRSGSAVVLRSVVGVRLADTVMAVLAGEGRPAGIVLQGLCAGVTIEDNLVIAPDGIRSEAAGGEDVPRFVLTAALRIADNILWCQRAGILLAGTVAHLFAHDIAGNQVLGCRDGAISVLGLALRGTAMRIERNTVSAAGDGIVAGVDGLWIEANKLTATRQGDREASGSAIVLRAGLDRNGSDQAQVLANQISGFDAAGIEVRSPVQALVCKMNLIDDCGLGIVMNEDAEAGAVAIENNQLRDIRGSGSDRIGLAAGIVAARCASATIAGNSIRRVSTGQVRTAITAGVMCVGVARSRIAGNQISEVGPPANVSGLAAGILVRSPFQQCEIQHNHVDRDGPASPPADDAPWVAVLVQETLPGRADNVAGSIERTGTLTTLRIDARRTLVLNQGRAFLGTVAVELDASGAAAARGGFTSLLGNSLAARGRVPAVIVVNSGETMMNDNRVELVAGDNVEAVRLTTPVLVLNANRVRHFGPAVNVTAPGTRVAALGNLTTGNISVGGNPLPAPWDALNLIG